LFVTFKEKYLVEAG